ncbi:MAG: glycosyltransferase family 2 protein [Chloroflexota bacterium]
MIPRVLAVVVQFNAAEMTGRCINSLRAQSAACNLLIVDNGSTDGSDSSLRSRLRPNDCLLHTDTPTGFANAVNLGLQLAKDDAYDYVFLVGNDVELAENALEHLMAAVVKDPRLAAVGPIQVYADNPQTVFTAGGRLTERTWSTSHEGWGQPLEQVQLECDSQPEWLDFAAVLIPMAVLSRVGHLRTGYGYYWEDVDWCLQSRALGYQLAVEPRAVVRHRVAGTAGQQPERKRYLWFRNRLLCAYRVRGWRFTLRLLHREWLFILRNILPRAEAIESKRVTATLDFTLRRKYRTYR